MKKTFMKRLAVALLITGLAGVAWAAGGHAIGHGGDGGMMSKDRVASNPATQPAESNLALNMLGEASVYLEKAQKAVAAGDAKAAAYELAQAQKALAALKEQLKSCPMMAQDGKPTNTHCPIMGGKIDPGSIKPDLTRQFKGKTIAFCCGGCPAQWDKLDDQQKQAKLDARKPADEKTEHKADPHGGHEH